jgi:hypothetical protein
MKLIQNDDVKQIQNDDVKQIQNDDVKPIKPIAKAIIMALISGIEH